VALLPFLWVAGAGAAGPATAESPARGGNLTSNIDTAQPVTLAIVLPLCFISGVFIPDKRRRVTGRADRSGDAVRAGGKPVAAGRGGLRQSASAER